MTQPVRDDSVSSPMSPLPDRLGLETMDIAADRIGLLREDFPEVFRDGKVDLDALRRALGEAVEPDNERFGLQWPGKAAAFQAIQTPSVGTLLPDPEGSVAWDTTGNVIIEGDNLEVLKLLQKSYYGRVKMIYIDPPYNTGNDFIYPDNYREGMQSYLEFTGQVNAEGKRLATNTESAGRYHSNWLNMMYPRLYLARNLLRDDGVIFVSIDDHEVANLRALMNEVFGEDNFIAELVWEKTRKNDAKLFSVGHEYMMVYARNLTNLKDLGTIWREPKPGAREIWNRYLELRNLHGSDSAAIETELREWYRSLPQKHPSRKLSRYKQVDEHGPWRDRDISWPGGGGPRYDVLHPVTGLPCKVPERGWIFSSIDVMNRQISRGLVVFREDHNDPPFRKAHLVPTPAELEPAEAQTEPLWEEDADDPEEAVGLQVMPSVIYKQSQVSVKYLRDLMSQKIFDNPKDHEVLARLIAYCTSNQQTDIVLDFFAGSGSTGHAVMKQNAEDGGIRRYILVQLPEPVDPPKTLDDGTTLATIAGITRERVRRAGRQIAVDAPGTDIGFRSYRLATSNFRPWDGTPPALANQGRLALGEAAPDPARQIAMALQAHTDNVVEGRSHDDILAEIILKLGYELTVPVESLTLAGKHVSSVDDGAVLVCLNSSLTLDVFEAMVERGPGQIVCLDSGFGDNDELKVNATQIIRSKARSDEATIRFWVV